MNLRHDAHCILAAARTALRSGEWIPSDETAVVHAVSALEAALGGIVPMSAIQPLYDDVCEQIGHAVTTGDWFPGDWASEWQGCYIGDHVGETVDMSRFRPAAAMLLAA
jgi:hypothetical protein